MSGVGLRAWSIQEFLKRGVREYDFLGGVGRHKSDWGSQDQAEQAPGAGPRASPQRSVLPRPAVGIASARVGEAVRAGTACLAAREARQQRRALGDHAAGKLPDAAIRRWPVVYFHSPLPSLVPAIPRSLPVERLAPTAMAASSAYRSGSEASARILYFHRVNDESRSVHRLDLNGAV